MTRPTYPDGITRMDDYIGCVVQLKKDLTLSGGRIVPAGRNLIVHSHHRGRLTLYWPENDTAQPGKLAALKVERYHIKIVAEKIA